MVADSVKLVLVQSSLIRGQQTFSQFQIEDLKSESACSLLISRGVRQTRMVFAKDAKRCDFRNSQSQRGGDIRGCRSRHGGILLRRQGYQGSDHALIMLHVCFTVLKMAKKRGKFTVNDTNVAESAQLGF